MSSLEVKSVSSPDETRPFADKGQAAVVNVGDHPVLYGTFEPGWRWSEHVKPIVGGDSCQALHQGVVTAGHLRVRSNDGTEEEYKAGDVWVIQPGHDAWVVGKEDVIAYDLSPAAADYAKRR